MKECKNCKECKSNDKFYKNKKNKDGLYTYCTDCAYYKKIESQRTKKGWVYNSFYNQKKSNKTVYYTKKELLEWCIKRVDFNNVFKQWEKSGFKKKMAPSIDRLDNYKGYSLNNIQVITYEQNIQKGNEDRKNGKNNKMNRAVIRIDAVTLETLEEYYSLNEAGRRTGISYKNIFKVCRKERVTAGGFRWEYK